MSWFLIESRQAVRRLLRSPGFTAITLLTLAIAIGANTAIFTVVNAVLLKPLPLPDSGRLVTVGQTAPGLGIADLNASPSTYFTFREENRTLEDIGLWRQESVTITGLAEPERVESLAVTSGVLPVLGIQPARGRHFSALDDSPNQPLTVMLSHGYWQRKFGGDPAVLGRRILVSGRAREVIGVLPASFQFMNVHPGVVIPFQLNRGKAFVGEFSYRAVARLKPGVTLAEANGDVARMLLLLPQRFPMAPGISLGMFQQARIGPNVRLLKEDVIGDIGKVLWVLLASIGIVLLIACANVANLMLVRVEGRHRELAMRAALGAGRGRLAAELLLESGLLGLAGGALGAAFAYAALQLLRALAPPYVPRLEEIQMDAAALLFALAVSLAAGLLFGLIPVWKYSRSAIGGTLHSGGRTMSAGRERHRARNTLAVVQVALALVLLVCAGLMIRTLGELRNVDPGFRRPDQIMTFRYSVPEALVADAAAVTRLSEAITHHLAAIPGVESVGMVNAVPIDGGQNDDPLFAEDKSYREGQLPAMRRHKYVAPGYFQTMGNPLKAGRDFTWADVHEMRPVTLVSENLAVELWGSAPAAIGKRVRETRGGVWREVVGVTGNDRDDGVDHPAPTTVYWPMAVKDLWKFPLTLQRSMAVVIRSPRAGSGALLSEIRQAIWDLNANLPLANPRTMQEIYERSMARTSFTLLLLSLAAGMALLLGILGIYGVISYSVSQRTREIGIRLALGSPEGAIRGMFLRYGLTLAAIGLACGLAASALVSRLLSTLLFGVSPLDPATYAAVAAVIVSAAALAAYLPARRATSVEPVAALRSE